MAGFEMNSTRRFISSRGARPHHQGSLLWDIQVYVIPGHASTDTLRILFER